MADFPRQDQSFGIIPIRIQGEETLFLLIQHHAGHWGFPKGHAEPGETALTAACRELEEETGITRYQPIATPCWHERYYTQKKGTLLDKQVTYFLAIVQDSQVTIQAKEIQAYHWDKFEDALNRLTYPSSRDVLIQVQHYLSSQFSGQPATS